MFPSVDSLMGWWGLSFYSLPISALRPPQCGDGSLICLWEWKAATSCLSLQGSWVIFTVVSHQMMNGFLSVMNSTSTFRKKSSQRNSLNPSTQPQPLICDQLGVTDLPWWGCVSVSSPSLPPTLPHTHTHTPYIYVKGFSHRAVKRKTTHFYHELSWPHFFHPIWQHWVCEDRGQRSPQSGSFPLPLFTCFMNIIHVTALTSECV